MGFFFLFLLWGVTGEEGHSHFFALLFVLVHSHVFYVGHTTLRKQTKYFLSFLDDNLAPFFFFILIRYNGLNNNRDKIKNLHNSLLII